MILQHDDDAVTRWDAAQIFATTCLNHLINDFNAESLATYRIPPGFIAAIRKMLGDPATDPELLSLILTPPSETILIEGFTAANPDHIHQVRHAWRAKLGRELANEFSQKYKKLTQFLKENTASDTAAPDNAAMAARSLAQCDFGVGVRQ